MTEPNPNDFVTYRIYRDGQPSDLSVTGEGPVQRRIERLTKTQPGHKWTYERDELARLRKDTVRVRE